MIDSVASQDKQQLDDDLDAYMCRTGNAYPKTIMFYSMAGSRPKPSMTLYM